MEQLSSDDLASGLVPAPVPPPDDAPEPEEWREVVGFPNYLVSSLGRIYSIPRTHTRGGILAQTEGPAGYLEVCLTAPGGRQDAIHVHRIVAAAFLGPRPKDKMTRHGPRGQKDNRASQLRYGSVWDNNVPDKLRDGTLLSGEDIWLAKLTVEIVGECRRRSAAGETCRSLAVEFGVSEPTMSSAISGKSWAECQVPTRSGIRTGVFHRDARLTPEAVFEARTRYAQGESVCSMAPGYGVSPSTLQAAVNGKTWKSVPMPGAA